MSAIVNVVQIPSGLRWDNVKLARVPCVGEFMYTEDLAFTVNSVMHSLDPELPTIVRVTVLSPKDMGS
jgi:hypothetical protein